MSDWLHANGARDADVWRSRHAARPARGADRATVAVVVHHRCPAALRSCIHALSESHPDLPVVIVENGSRDQSVTAVRMVAVEHSMTTLVEVPFCRGHCAGLNLGIDTALEIQPELGQVLLIDCDSWVGPGLLDGLLDLRRRRPDAGIIGSNIRSSELGHGLFEQGCVQAPFSTPVREQSPNGGVETEVDFVDPGAMLLSAELIAAGLRFDTGYFDHLASVDLCREATEEGFEVWVRRTDAVHRSEASEREIAWDPIASQPAALLRSVAESRVYYLRKWLAPKKRWLGIGRLLIEESFRGICWSLSRGGRPRFLRAWFDGLRAGFSIPLPGSEVPPDQEGHEEELHEDSDLDALGVSATGRGEGPFEGDEDEWEAGDDEDDWEDGDGGDGFGGEGDDWDFGDDDSRGLQPGDPASDETKAEDRIGGVGGSADPRATRNARKSAPQPPGRNAGRERSSGRLDRDEALSFLDVLDGARADSSVGPLHEWHPETDDGFDEGDEFVVAFDATDWAELTGEGSSPRRRDSNGGELRPVTMGQWSFEDDLQVHEILEEPLEIVDHEEHLVEAPVVRPSAQRRAPGTTRSKAVARPGAQMDPIRAGDVQRNRANRDASDRPIRRADQRRS